MQTGSLSEALLNAIATVSTIVSVLTFLLGFASGAIVIHLRAGKRKPREEFLRRRAQSLAQQAQEVNATPYYNDNTTPYY